MKIAIMKKGKPTKNKKPLKLILDSYLALIKNSIGANFWRNFYIKEKGKKKDVLEEGTLSCAFFVSTVLVIFELVNKVHFTVVGTLKEMEDSGWYKIKKPKLGSVLVWEEKFDQNKHVGFFMGDNSAISNRSSLHKPGRHHFTFGQKKDGQPVRKIEKIYWHKKLK